jgi:hypothetical protein
MYRATPTGISVGQRLLSELPAATADDIRELSEWVRQQSMTSLLASLFHEFPEMMVRAVFREAT